MEKRKAVYAASFDPITNGHLNVIERMAPLYGELIVLVAVDGKKNYMFTSEERAAMARAAVAHLSNVTVGTCIGRYVVRVAEEADAQVIIRGLRNFKDLEDEQVLAMENRQIAPSVETMLVPCLPQLMHVSSSMVKGHVGIDPDWESQVARSVPAGVVVKLKEKHILARAAKHWTSLMAELGNPKGAPAVFERLVACYGEMGRFYHVLEHVVHMLDETDLAIGALNNPLAVKLAIWFHDSVYDTGNKDRRAVFYNETLSACMAERELLALGFASDLVGAVKALIMVTSYATEAENDDARFLSDLDIAILGKPPKEFDRYEADIRKEYAHVGEGLFCERRKMILRKILERKPLYRTEPFRLRYESAARANLARSIKQLEK